tara:strand:- start:791 stop:1036 length:246 start_codon:yes stop_codon:yes gene_type:complete
MRISVDTLLEIQKITGHEIEVGGQDDNTITLRFGYWRQLSESDLTKVKELLTYRSIVEQLVDEDDECGELWNYIVSYNPFK